METVIHLTNGMRFNIETDYNAQLFAKNLNSQNLQMLTVGDAVVAKTAITYIAPKLVPENANVQVYLTDGRVLKTFIPDFNPENVSTDSNNPQTHVLAIGEIVVSKYLVMMVVPVRAEESQNS